LTDPFTICPTGSLVQLHQPIVGQGGGDLAFFEAVDGGAAPPVGGEDGYRALEIVMAAYLSLRERRPVKLPLDPDIEIAPPAF
jgi:predicted dehydrogenase